MGRFQRRIDEQIKNAESYRETELKNVKSVDYHIEDILKEAQRDREGEIRTIHQNYYTMHAHHCERDGQM